MVNLKLLSVMCAPLMHKGELFGLIYVGNDRLVNRFDEKASDTLTIFAAAGLAARAERAAGQRAQARERRACKTRLEEHAFGDIIGACQGMREVYKRIDKIAPTDISVLITGETGTGKELIAREIHRHSPRAKGPFITINCGAIPENLLESELFGHVKGAFTGAVATKQGKFQAANGGTLFLDEIGEMPLQLQVKLLRALQEKVVYKVGDNRPEPVDIRVVAATNKNLEEEVRKGAFREDLYYRLNVVTLKLPPLRERGEDIMVIAKLLPQHATRGSSTRRPEGFSPSRDGRDEEVQLAGQHPRAREPHQEGGGARRQGAARPRGPRPAAREPRRRSSPLAQAKEEFQKRYINEVLERNNGNRTKTAKDLGVDPRTIFRHLEKLESEKNDDALSSVTEMEEI